MMRAMLWKEYREQRLPTLLLTALGLLLLALTVPIMQVQDENYVRFLLAILFVWACGMVTGAILLANERESATQAFLDTLPRWRRQLWFSKLAFGAGVTFFQVLLFFACWLLLCERGTRPEPAPGWGIANLTLFAFLGLGCGMFGSAIGRSVLTAVGWAIVGMFPGVTVVVAGVLWLLGLLIALLVAWIATTVTHDQVASDLLLIGIPVVVAIPFLTSRLIYTRVDRLRKTSGRLSLESIAGKATRSRWGVKSTLWLSWRQGWRFHAGLLIAAAVCGPLVITDIAACWPALTLLFGVLSGVGVLADEQQLGTYRFLGEQRLMLRRWWLVKVLSRFVTAVIAVTLMAITALVAAEFVHLFANEGVPHLLQRLRDGHVVNEFIFRGAGFSFATLWLLYGFGFGLLAGMLVRKTIVALALALPAAALAVLLWVPSLLSGGLSYWQVHAVPLALMALACVSAWAWATERLFTRRHLLVWGATFALAAAWSVGSLGYRVWQVPAAPQPFDVAAFEAHFKTKEMEEPRGLVTEAASQVHSRAAHYAKEDAAAMARNTVAPALPWIPTGAGMPLVIGGWVNVSQPPPREQMFFHWMMGVGDFGWHGSKNYEERLEQMTSGTWIHLLEQAASKPRGPLEGSRNRQQISDLRTIGPMLSARALQLQARGDNTGALRLLGIGLALARHAQTHVGLSLYYLPEQLESDALRGIERWSDHPGVPVDLLQQMLAILQQHERERPPLSEIVKTEYTLTHERLDQPLDVYGARRTSTHDDALNDTLVMSSVIAPWERARRARLVNNYISILLEASETPFPELLARTRAYVARLPKPTTPLEAEEHWAPLWLPPVGFPDHAEEYRALARMIMSDTIFRSASHWYASADSAWRANTCRVRALQLKLALLLFQLRNGRPASALSELVPGLLPAIPLDPFADAPFRYRVSDGENLRWFREIPVNGLEGWLIEESPVFAGSNMPTMMGGAAAAPGGAAAPIPGNGPKYRPARAGETAQYRRVPKDWGILWSVCSDGADNGGVEQSHGIGMYFEDGRSRSPSDLIFLVPKIGKK